MFLLSTWTCCRSDGEARRSRRSGSHLLPEQIPRAGLSPGVGVRIYRSSSEPRPGGDCHVFGLDS